MPAIGKKCANCGAPVVAVVSQSSDDRSVYLQFEYHCEQCGRDALEDEKDAMSQAAREAILAEEGRWQVRLTSIPSDRVLEFLTLVKKLFKLNQTSIAKLKGRLPGIIRTGTRVETEFLARRIGALGFDVIAEQEAKPS